MLENLVYAVFVSHHDQCSIPAVIAKLVDMFETRGHKVIRKLGSQAIGEEIWVEMDAGADPFKSQLTSIDGCTQTLLREHPHSIIRGRMFSLSEEGMPASITDPYINNQIINFLLCKSHESNTVCNHLNMAVNSVQQQINQLGGVIDYLITKLEILSDSALPDLSPKRSTSIN